jgi:hypothetical protein
MAGTPAAGRQDSPGTERRPLCPDGRVAGRPLLGHRRAGVLRGPSIRVFLTRGYAEGSCEARDLARHERRHDDDIRANVAEAERRICDTAGTWPGRSTPAPIRGGQLMGLLDDWMAFERRQLQYDNWLDACTWGHGRPAEGVLGVPGRCRIRPGGGLRRPLRAPRPSTSSPNRTSRRPVGRAAVLQASRGREVAGLGPGSDADHAVRLPDRAELRRLVGVATEVGPGDVQD